MFHYSLVPGYDAERAKQTGLDFLPTVSRRRKRPKGTTVEGKQIPGLGDPNVPEANSLWVIDVADPAQPKVIAKIKTGIRSETSPLVVQAPAL